MNKRSYRLTVILLHLLLVISSRAIGQEHKKVHLTGNFPDLPGARMFIVPLKIGILH